jgi:hypothetical protein
MGAKITPTMKKRGRTVFGVKMGCHAFKRCCLNAVFGGLLLFVFFGSSRLGS